MMRLCQCYKLLNNEFIIFESNLVKNRPMMISAKSLKINIPIINSISKLKMCQTCFLKFYLYLIILNYKRNMCCKNSKTLTRYRWKAKVSYKPTVLQK